MTAAKPLLRQNSEMRKDRVWNWTLPAWVTTFEDGTSFNVCPQAGACAKVCYARNGTYLFPKVIESHQRNLMLARGPEDLFIGQMVLELTGKKFRPSGETRLPELDRAHLPEKITSMLDGGCAAVRIHDSGDFFSEQYLDAWTSIAKSVPDVLFYAYTKEVTLLKEHMGSHWWPENFLICFSLGGTSRTTSWISRKVGISTPTSSRAPRPWTMPVTTARTTTTCCVSWPRAPRSASRSTTSRASARSWENRPSVRWRLHSPDMPGR